MRVQRLAMNCLAHLEQEEAMLQASAEALREVRHALLSGDLGGVSDALAHQDHTAKAAGELKEVRMRLRGEIARVLKLPLNQATIRRLVDDLPGDLGHRLAARHGRLSELAEEVQALVSGNAALVRQSMDLLSGLLSSLTGDPGGAERYSPGGELQRSSFGHVFQTDC